MNSLSTNDNNLDFIFQNQIVQFYLNYQNLTIIERDVKPLLHFLPCQNRRARVWSESQSRLLRLH